MPILRRSLFVGCFLFIASLFFGVGFLGYLGYLTAVSTDPNHGFSQIELMNAVLLGLGATVLTVRFGYAISRFVLRSRLITLMIILALAGYVSAAVLFGGLLNYIFSPYL